MKARLFVLALVCAVMAAGTLKAEETKPKKRLGILQQLEKDIDESNIKKDTKEGIGRGRAEMRGEEYEEEHAEGEGESAEAKHEEGSAEDHGDEGEARKPAAASILADVAALRGIAKELKAGGNEEAAKKIEAVADSIEKKMKGMRERMGTGRRAGEAGESAEKMAEAGEHKDTKD